MIEEIASADSTMSCIICNEKLGVTVWRPSPCSKDGCRQTLKRWSLETRLSPFLRYPRVLDFLLACLYTGQTTALTPDHRPPEYARGGFKPPGFSWDDLCSTIDAFAAIGNETTLSDLMLDGGDKATKEKLHSWLCTEFEGTLVPAPLPTRVGFPDSEQFLILNGPIVRSRGRSKTKRRRQ